MIDDIRMTEDVLNTYAKLHAMPEPALKEYRTSAYLAERLKAAGFTVKDNIGGSTAVLGTLEARRPGPVIVLRSDMDALPYTGDDGASLARHTCGHDANAAMVLTCAESFAKDGGLPEGELRVLFQPAEETMAGAKIVIASGVISDADIIIGIHLRPETEAALHQATPELLHGAVCHLKLRIYGKAAHAGRPHQGINALNAAAAAVVAVNTLQFDPEIPHSAKVTSLTCGNNACNIIPARADMVFDLRAQNNAIMDKMLEQTKTAITDAVEGAGARVEFTCENRARAAEYDAPLCACAKKAIENALGSALPPVATMGSEDFHYYGAELGLRPVYIGLGAGMQGGLHSENMCFDTAALSDGVRILYGTVLEILAAGARGQTNV